MNGRVKQTECKRSTDKDLKCRGAESDGAVNNRTNRSGQNVGLRPYKEVCLCFQYGEMFVRARQKHNLY